MTNERVASSLCMYYVAFFKGVPRQLIRLTLRVAGTQMEWGYGYM